MTAIIYVKEKTNTQRLAEPHADTKKNLVKQSAIEKQQFDSFIEGAEGGKKRKASVLEPAKFVPFKKRLILDYNEKKLEFEKKYFTPALRQWSRNPRGAISKLLTYFQSHANKSSTNQATAGAYIKFYAEKFGNLKGKISTQLLERINSQFQKDGLYFYVLGDLYYYAGKDNERAYLRYLDAIKNGCAEAYNAVGVMWEKGEGLLVNKDKALNCYKLAHEKGSAQGSFNYGILLEERDPKAVNGRELVEIYNTALNRGALNAKKHLLALAQKNNSYALELLN